MEAIRKFPGRTLDFLGKSQTVRKFVGLFVFEDLVWREPEAKKNKSEIPEDIRQKFKEIVFQKFGVGEIYRDAFMPLIRRSLQEVFEDFLPNPSKNNLRIFLTRNMNEITEKAYCLAIKRKSP